MKKVTGFVIAAFTMAVASQGPAAAFEVDVPATICLNKVATSGMSALSNQTSAVNNSTSAEGQVSCSLPVQYQGAPRFVTVRVNDASSTRGFSCFLYGSDENGSNILLLPGATTNAFVGQGTVFAGVGIPDTVFFLSVLCVVPRGTPLVSSIIGMQIEG